MRKRNILSFICLLIVFILVGCSGGGGSSTESNGEGNNSSADTEKTETNESSEEKNTGEESSSTTELNAENKYGLSVDSITVATSPGYEPFEFMEGDELVGYDVDIWNEFEERTGIEVKWEQADFAGLLGLLDTERSDVIAAQMGPTPEREEKYAFSDPISYFGSIVAVPEDSNVEDPTTELSGSTLGVGAGNEQQNTLQNFYEDGELNWEIYNSGTLENMLSDVEYGRIDGAVGQNIQVAMAIDKSGASLKLTKPFEESTGTFVVRKDDTELLNAINAFISDIKEDGTLSEISNKWIGMDISEPQS